MLTTVHLFSGAAIGVVLKDPLLIAPAAFAVHYVLDGVPHYAPTPVKGFKAKGLKGASLAELLDKGLEPVVGVGILIGLVLVASPNLKVPILIGAFFGWLPDLLEFLKWKHIVKFPKFIEGLDNKYHRHKHVGGIGGFLPQGLVAAFCLLYLLVKVRN